MLQKSELIFEKIEKMRKYYAGINPIYIHNPVS